MRKTIYHIALLALSFFGVPAAQAQVGTWELRTSEAQIHRERLRVRDVILKSMGEVPASCAVDRGKVGSRNIVKETAKGTIWRIEISSCGTKVPALLAIPSDADARTPVVIAMHQTADVGKNEVLGLAGNKALDYGKKFLDAGFVVIAPDIFIAGDNFKPERYWNTAEFYMNSPHWSAMGRMLEDHRSVIDALRALGRTPQCIAAVGHSLGGHNALFLGALDERVDVVVSNDGFERIATDTDAKRWARDSLFTYMPALKPYVDQPAPRTVPWDFEDVLLAIYPRPLMVLQAKDDPVWTHEESVGDVAGLMTTLYARSNQDDFRYVSFSGGHEFPQRYQMEAVRFVKTRCRSLAGN